MYSGTRSIAEQLGIEGPVACVDGCHIVHVGTRQDLFVAEIVGPPRQKLREALLKVSLACFVFASDVIVYDRFGKRHLGYLRTWSERILEIDSVTSLAGWASLSQMNALVGLGSQADVETVVCELAHLLDSQLQVATFPLRASGNSHLWAIIVRAAGVDKGTAVRFLAEYHGIGLDQVIAVGDWVNDVPMFKVVGRSFAMGHAPDEVKGTAKSVLRAHVTIGGGIREAAERSGLL
jgi:hydroxymethylpyrimidine pyrophosphatase-like HAD family hydrolase